MLSIFTFYLTTRGGLSKRSSSGAASSGAVNRRESPPPPNNIAADMKRFRMATMTPASFVPQRHVCICVGRPIVVPCFSLPRFLEQEENVRNVESLSFVKAMKNLGPLSDSVSLCSSQMLRVRLVFPFVAGIFQICGCTPWDPSCLFADM
jgi:hypothetical protein